MRYSQGQSPCLPDGLIYWLEFQTRNGLKKELLTESPRPHATVCQPYFMLAVLILILILILEKQKNLVSLLIPQDACGFVILF
jgi:hypothetical protein